MAIRVFIVGDVRLHREGLALQLKGFSSLAVIGTGHVGDAVQAMRQGSVDVVLLDSFNPDSPQTVAALRQGSRRLRIVVMGIHEVESEVLACAAAGIDGYIRMEAAIGDVVKAIECVLRDELLCSPKVAASLYHSVALLGNSPEVALTNRELQVVELMNRGLSNKEISNRLQIETCTAKNHVQNIMQKLGVHRRGQAVAKVRGAIGQRFG